MAPQIYVGDYASYNNGFLHGRWLDLSDKTAEEIQSEVAAILADNSRKLGETCEEPMYQDYEWFPRAFYSECGINFELLVRYLELEKYGQERLEAYLEFYPADLEQAFENYEDVIIWGSFDGMIEQMPIWDEVPEAHHHYIDTDAIRRDLEINGSFVHLDDGRIAELPR